MKSTERTNAILVGLLRPAVRFCLKRGLHIHEVLEAAKCVFLSETAKTMDQAGEKANVSRLSAATGIHRRDVMRIVKRGEVKSSPQGLVNRILGQWQHDKDFRETSSGKARRLRYEGEANEFAQLVQRVSHDLNPGTVLFELERLGAVERKGKYLLLRSKAYVPTHDEIGSYELLANDLGALAETVEQNLQRKLSERNLHATTEFDNIRVESLPRIRSWLLKEGSQFHHRVRSYLAKFDADISPRGEETAGARVVFSSFSLTEDS